MMMCLVHGKFSSYNEIYVWCVNATRKIKHGFSSFPAGLHFNCGSHGVINRLVMTWHLLNEAEDVHTSGCTVVLHFYNVIGQGAY